MSFDQFKYPHIKYRFYSFTISKIMSREAKYLEKMSERNFKSRYIVNKCIAGDRDHVIVHYSYDLK